METSETSSNEELVPFYRPEEIEAKWQARWEADGLYHADVDPARPKFYALTMLPYPSGDLHIGHWYAMTPADARARFMRMRGYNVMFPIGFDAFGLPAENAAIRRGIHPKTWTYDNIARMRQQLKSMGAMFDWRREAISADPQYYRWTQWFFLQFYKHGLAYRKRSWVDWCPNDNTTLAREQVVEENGVRVCERCGTPVIRKDLEQWFFRITQYADELLRYDGIDWPERVRTLQTNWIGRSEGASIRFPTAAGEPLEVFTTRPDTLWGATFMVIAPEHPLLPRLTTPEQQPAVDAYVEQALRQSDIQREAADREKTGVFTGSYATNPATGEPIPIWVADYVLITYGTGAIMAVPAHDERDFEFARKFNLPIRVVVQPDDMDPLDAASMESAVPALGTLIDSGPLTGTPGEEAKERAITYLEDRGIGQRSVSYRLRDWLISRQRYWGAPIPIIYCPNCGVVPVPEDQLPVELPEDVQWLPTGQSPLKLHPTWRFTTCPQCGGPAERETDTMDTFMCSSWYHLRYLSPQYDQGAFNPREYDYWMPVDVYTGGIEHATMHLLYTRFFHKALRDMGIVKGDEPMLLLRNQGIVLGEDSEKMSKSRGNVVAPDDLVQHYGADTVRAYLMFFARWDQGGPWSGSGIGGVARWIRRVWTLVLEPAERTVQADPNAARALRRKLHQTLAAVTRDFDAFEFNTIISSLMELSNEMGRLKPATYGTSSWNEAVEDYLLMLAPVAPHISEELWQRLGEPYSIHQQPWPEIDQEAAKVEEITLVVQINGKVRDRLTVPAGIDAEDAIQVALQSEVVRQALGDTEPRQTVYVPGRLVNIVL